MKLTGYSSLFLILILLSTAGSSCKKEKQKTEDQEEIVSPLTGTRRQFTLDSVFLYAKQIYLWNDVLPSYAAFDPRNKYQSYSSDLKAFQMELFDISQIKQNPQTQLAYEYSSSGSKAKYSYLQAGKTNGGAVAGSTDGTNNPVLAASVLQAGNAQVGYIALASFPKLSACKSALDAAFEQLPALSIQDLIIDLRSNGGGYVETAEYVANLIAPAGLNGKVMYTEQFNAMMQTGKALILRHQPYLDETGKQVDYNGRGATLADVDFTETGNTYRFSKKGELKGVKNVYFIVSGATASASELLINCLKPHLNVRLAGTRTYGKPVGFFGVVIDQYTVYMSGFLIKNAEGSADYFNGMAVDIAVEADGHYPLGDPNEACLNKVLNHIQTQTHQPVKAAKVLSILKSMRGTATKTTPVTEIADAFNTGMIEHRRKLRK